MTVRLAVFDCDGTLVDGQANIVRAMDATFEAHGLNPPTSHDTRRIVGLSLTEAMAVLLPNADAALHAVMAREFKTAYQRLRADGRLDPEPLYDGVAEGLEALGAAGWAMGVATGKSDRGLAYVLAHHGLAHYFITLQTADRHPSKPHPSMLRAALAEAGADACDAVMVGDTVFDMAMASAARVRAIGVAYGYHERGELLAAGAERVADSFADVVAGLL